MVEKLIDDRAIRAHALPGAVSTALSNVVLGAVPGAGGSLAPARIGEPGRSSLQPASADGRPQVEPHRLPANSLRPRIRQGRAEGKSSPEPDQPPAAKAGSSAQRLLQSILQRRPSDLPQFQKARQQCDEEAQRLSTSLIRSCSWEVAVYCVDALRREQIPITAHIHGALMAKAESDGRPDVVRSVHDALRADLDRHQDLKLDWAVCTSIVATLGRSGFTAQAEGLFRTMLRLDERVDLKAFGALMSAYAQRGSQEAAEAVERLQRELAGHGLSADEMIVGTRVRAQANAGNLPQALVLWGHLLEAGMALHHATGHALIDAFTLRRQPEQALRVMEQMIQRGVMPNSVTFAKLMRCCEVSQHAPAAASAIRRCIESGLLVPSAGYHEPSNVLALGPRDALQHEAFWRCTERELVDVGAALARFHLAAGRALAPSRVEGPGPAKAAAVRVIEMWRVDPPSR